MTTPGWEKIQVVQNICIQIIILTEVQLSLPKNEMKPMITENHDNTQHTRRNSSLQITG